MSRSQVRVPNIPLDYLEIEKSVAREIIVDYENKKIFVKSKDGLSFIGFNTRSDDHIANADIHVTLEQKNTFEESIMYLDGAINTINDEILPLKAPLDSPIFTGTPTSTNPETTDNSIRVATTSMVQLAIAAGNAHSVDGKHVDDTQTSTSYLWTANKIKVYVDSLLASNDAMVFKGTIGTGGTVTAIPTTGYNAGWSYKVITAGTYAGMTCEIGDMIICVKDYTLSYADGDWIVIQTNLDGAVTCSETSTTDGHIAVFNGSSGKLIKSGGKALPSGNLVGDASYATSSVAGVVKSSASSNQVLVDASGLMTVNTIDATKGGTGKNSIAADAMLYASAIDVYSEIITSAFGRSLLNATSGVKFEGLNADMINGVCLSRDSNLGSTWSAIPFIRSDGGMELGIYLDFHMDSNDIVDYVYRLTAGPGELIGSHRFTAPELKVTSKMNINEKAFIQYNETDDCMEFVFA